METKHHAWWVSIVLCTVVFTVNAEAQRKFGVGVTGGSSGIGGEAIVRINHHFNARAGFQLFNYNLSGTYDEMEVGIDYDGKANISSISLLADYYPFKRYLKISAGIYNLNLDVNGNAIPNESYEFEGRFLEPERLGSLSGDVTYTNTIAPYFGLGMGNAVSEGIPFRFNLDLGVLYTGAPNIDMDGSGMIASTADNESKIQAGLDEFEWYPIVRIGFSYAFINVK